MDASTDQRALRDGVMPEVVFGISCNCSFYAWRHILTLLVLLAFSHTEYLTNYVRNLYLSRESFRPVVYVSFKCKN